MVYINVDGWKANFAIESLKQLKGAASTKVVVAAQLGIEGENDYRRYVFNGAKGAKKEATSLKLDRKDWDHAARPNMATANTLTAFIRWARKQQQANRYCLVLWMDGVLPLYEPLARRNSQEMLKRAGKKSANGQRRARYIQPFELRQALERARLDDAKGPKAKKFDIVAMDACSMSMIEYAYELKDVAEYLVASEEAVPYWSFPYTSILGHFRRSKAKADMRGICKAIAKDYTEAYQDCLCTTEAGINPVTLSALRLGSKGIGAIASPLNKLARLLQAGATNGKSNFSDAILRARKNSQDFAFGAFVDLANFCHHLSRQKTASKRVKKACQQVCEILREEIVKANEVDEKLDSNSFTGAMIYFPYCRENKQKDKTGVVLDKGLGSSSGEGGLGKSAAALRQEVIKDIEGYYQNEDFEFGQATEWYKFIRNVWSPILATNEPRLLDLRYSAEQCAANLLNGSEIKY
jgi:hypothetical protein